MDDQNWKQKYQDLLAKLEAREKQWQLTSSLLRQGMSCVSIAAQGKDAQLDQDLSLLRQFIAKRSIDPAQLEEAIEALSASVTRLDETNHNEAETIRTQALLMQWMDSLSLPGHLINSLKQLRNKVNQSTALTDLDAPLRELATLINSCLQVETINPADTGNQEQHGLLHKLLFGRKRMHNSDDQTETATIDEVALLRDFSIQLLEKLGLPHEVKAQVEDLKDHLARSVSTQDIVKAISAFADLTASMQRQVKAENHELQSFLQQLTENLQEIDQHLAGAQNHQRAAIDHSRKLDEAVHSQVNQIETTFNEELEPEVLKSQIQHRVIAIREHLLQYRQSDEKNQELLQAQLEQLNTRVQNMESEGAQLRQRLKEKHELAMHDPLTGLYNRLAYEERLAQERSRCERYGTPLVLMVIDIDRFKEINDNYGHSAGDKALKLIATQMQKNLRTTDFLARFGGEEFVVLMPETDIPSAIIAANKLRETVAECKFHYQGVDVTITVSAGLALLREGENEDTLFQRADEALLNAKKAGRNRCEIEQG